MGARYGDASARGTGASESTTAVAQEVLAGSSAKRGLARVLPFLGPAFVAAVAYVDPGNFATNIAGGAQFGYLLLWVIVASNLMAMLIQALSAKLGIATGRNLAEVIRDEFPKPLVYLMWVVGEVVAIATDLAEFLGAAVGFNLLLGIPLLWAGLLTGFITFLILGLQRYGYRPLEIVITLMVGIIAGSYVIETFLGRPDWGQIAYHAAVPQFQGTESVLLATGILGATVMPHVIFLHSALTQNRIVVRDIEKAKRLFRYELIDVVVAMSLAGLVNAAMLITAAAAFHQRGVGDVGTLEQAHDQATACENELHQALPGLDRIVSHLEPAAAEPTQALPDRPDQSQLVQMVQQILRSYVPQVHVHEVQVVRSSHGVSVSFHCTLPGQTALTEAHHLAERLEKHLRSRLPGLERVIIHVEPEETQKTEPSSEMGQEPP